MRGLTGTRSRQKSSAYFNSAFAGSKPTDLAELRERHDWAVYSRQHRVRILVLDMVEGALDSFACFAERNYMFDPSSAALLAWDWFMASLAIYSAITVPLYIVLTETQWPGYATLDPAAAGPRHRLTMTKDGFVFDDSGLR